MTTPQNNRFNEQKQSLCTRVLHFAGYTSLPSSTKQQREMTTYKFLWRTRTDDGEFFIFFLNLYATPTNLVPGYFAIFVKGERVGIIVK